MSEIAGLNGLNAADCAYLTYITSPNPGFGHTE